MTFQELISKANFNWVNENITETNFPFKSEGLEEVKIYQFDSFKTTEEILKSMDEDGYQPARLEHLLHYIIKNPEKSWIVALGSVWDGNAPYVRGNGAYRGLNLGDLAYDWDSDCAFAAVKQVALETLGSKCSDLGNLDVLYCGHCGKKMDIEKQAKELSECLDLMPKDLKELQSMAFNIALDMAHYVTNPISSSNSQKPSEKIEKLCAAYNKLLENARNEPERNELNEKRNNDTIALLIFSIDELHERISKLENKS